VSVWERGVNKTCTSSNYGKDKKKGVSGGKKGSRREASVHEGVVIGDAKAGKSDRKRRGDRQTQRFVV